jgi:hypothetical protein
MPGEEPSFFLSVFPVPTIRHMFYKCRAEIREQIPEAPFPKPFPPTHPIKNPIFVTFTF